MATGTVKWFNNAKGYGFILPEQNTADGVEDLFIHYSSIQMEGYKSLKAGQMVEYELQEGPKGLHAVNIRAAAGEKLPEAAPVTAPVTASEPASETVTAPTGTEDNLHLNPMRTAAAPGTANGTATAQPASTQAPASSPEKPELEVEEG